MTASDANGPTVSGSVREQILALADRQLEPGYFPKRTPHDSAAAARQPG